MSYYSISLCLTNKKVIIIGGGSVAYRKISPLLEAGAQITLVSPNSVPQIKTLASTNEINWIKQNYHKSLLEGATLVLACTNRKEINQQVADDAKQNNILVNIVDNIDVCDFITPAVIKRPPVQIAFSSGGASPSLMRYLRRQFDKQLPQQLSVLALFAQEKRIATTTNLPNDKDRQAFWDMFFVQAQAYLEKNTPEKLEELYTQLLFSFLKSA